MKRQRIKHKAFIVQALDPRRNQKNFLQDADRRLWEALAISSNPKESSRQALRDNKAEERAKHAPNRWAKLRACPDVQGALRSLNTHRLGFTLA